MQAIRTQYRGPTNTRGSRVIVTCDAKRITVPWDHALGAPENHVAAARALIVALEWENHGTWVAGCLPDGSYAHVCAT